MFRLFFLSFVGTLFVSPSWGQINYDWNNASGGSFNTAANWTPAGPPSTTNHIARFPLSATYSVNFNSNVTLFRHTVVTGNVTWNLNGFTATFTDTINNGVGNNVTPTSLRILNGTVNTGNFGAGTTADVVSSVTLDQGAHVNVGSGAFFVGTGGTGTLTVQGGSTITTTTGSAGMAQNPQGTATINVIGSTSSINIAGLYQLAGQGKGTLNLINDGVFNAGSLDIGASIGGVGVVSLTGAGSTLTSNGTTNVGGTSNLFPATSATLNVGAGSTVNFNGTTNLRTVATVNLNGGTINLNALTVQPGAVMNWNAGKIKFANASIVTAPVLDFLLSGTNTLGAGRELANAAGTLNLQSPLLVNGGRISSQNVNVNGPLVVGAFGNVHASEIITIGNGTSLQVSDLGSLSAGTAIFNDGGTLQLNGFGAEVNGFMANNFGLIQGTGRFKGGLNNGTGGTIRARTGDHIIIDQTGLTNPGNIELAGGTIEYTKTLSNLGNGFISGRGEFRGSTSNPGGTGISNLGVMAFSGGTTDIRGDVQNSGSGRIVAAGGSLITFYDDVIHNGSEIRTNAGSRTVFFGSQTGAGPFTGTGVVEYSGDLRPGNSPANVSYEGDVILNPSARLNMELSGLVPGSEYDRLTISKSLSLSGRLELRFINGFQPQIGQSFKLIDMLSAQPIDGTFVGLPEGSLFSVNGFQFQASYVGGNGNDFVVTAVPEPHVLAYVALAAVGTLVRRRKQPGKRIYISLSFRQKP